MTVAPWTVTIVAGTGAAGCSGDGSTPLDAMLDNPFDLAFLSDGSLIFSDTFNHRIRRVDFAANTITTIAGCGERGFGGDSGPAIAARLNEPYGVVADRAGRIYCADRLNGRVRVIDTSGGIATLAGDGSASSHGDGGPAAQAGLIEPNGLALSPDGGRLFIADVAGHRVRVVDLATGLIDTFAGTGEGKHDGDGGPAKQAAIFGARAVAFAADGSLYVMERQGSCIRRIRDGIIETIAGTGGRGYAGDGGPARDAVFDRPKEMAVAPDGSIFVVDTENNAIRRIDGNTGIVTTIDGTLARPHGAAIGPGGAVYVGDSEHHQIRKLTPP
ncbi:hypothetical protein [Rhodopila sp.]|jgi:DNA-binding beta-propeller fold protein YncE|uniref:hypothetical protein n=1 Tax=Rhodopila sp. TaxID=2480087 RepID=UPI002C3D5C18|nr:hypothetical protein [Rhodopila sp.]HVZ10684.1 hypothetical protein [Rhodopila sp.]